MVGFLGYPAAAAATAVLAVAYIGISASGVFLFGSAYWLLLTTILLALVYFASKRPEKRPKLAIAYALVVPLIFGACVSSLVIQTQFSVRGLNVEVRAFFVFLSMLLCGAFAYYVGTAAEEKESEVNDKELAHYSKNLEEDEGVRCKSCNACCFPCCSIFMLVLLLLASIHAIVLAAEFAIYLPPPEAVVDVGGYNMFARCSGTGSPPVVMFHGYTGNSLDFQWIQRELEKTTRVCSFDRAGLGQSQELPVLPRTSEQHAKELDILLTGLNITGDFIAVGHSYAGFNMRTYNRDFPGRIKGMVMIDTVNPNTTSDCDPNVDANYRFGPLFVLGRYLVDSGIFRIMTTTGLVNFYAPINLLPADIQYEYYFNLQSWYFKTSIDEFTVWGKSCFGVKQLEGENKTLDFPLGLVLAGNGIFFDDIDAGAEQADLSPNSTLVVVPDVLHIDVLWEEKNARFSTDLALNIIDQYRSENP